MIVSSDAALQEEMEDLEVEEDGSDEEPAAMPQRDDSVCYFKGHLGTFVRTYVIV